MPDVRKSYVGLGAGTFGETVGENATLVHFFRHANEDLGSGEEISYVRDEYNFGTATPRNSTVAARAYGGSIGIENSSLTDIAKVAKFAFGAYDKVADTPVVGKTLHVFDVLEGSVGNLTVLPSATALLGVGGLTYFEYVGGQCNTFELSASAQSHSVSLNSSWMFRDRISSLAAVPVYEVGAKPLLWRDVAATIDGQPWTDIEQFRISLNQGLSSNRQANQSPTIAYYERSGNIDITLEFTVRYTGEYHADVLSGGYRDINIKIFTDVPGNYLELRAPRVQFEGADAVIQGQIPQTLSGKAYRDDVLGRSLRVAVYSDAAAY